MHVLDMKIIIILKPTKHFKHEIILEMWAHEMTFNCNYHVIMFHSFSIYQIFPQNVIRNIFLALEYKEIYNFISNNMFIS